MIDERRMSSYNFAPSSSGLQPNPHRSSRVLVVHLPTRSMAQSQPTSTAENQSKVYVEVKNLKHLAEEMNQCCAKVTMKTDIKNHLQRFMDVLALINSSMDGLEKLLELGDDLNETICLIRTKMFFFGKAVEELKTAFDRDPDGINRRVIEKFTTLKNTIYEMIQSMDFN